MIQKIKLLYVVSTLANSGPTNQLYNLISNLDKDTFTASILTLSEEPDNSKYQDFEKLGMQIDSLQLSRLEMAIQGKNRLEKLIKGINPDIIHTCGIRPDFYVSKYLGEYLHCNTIRNYPYEDYPVKFGRVKGTLMAHIHVSLHKKMHYPVSCSFSIANKLKARHDIDTYIIQNGINSECYSPADRQEKNKLRKQLNLPGKVLFIFVGALIDRKNPILLVRAFRDAKISDKAALVILGDGPLYSSCDLQKDESVIMKGNIGNVCDYLRASDIFVSPSKSEGLPNAVLEAMGTALPVILSDIEPHKEILTGNVDIGVLFKADNMAELSEFFKKAVFWDFEVMGKKSRDSLEENFTAKRMSLSYQDFYKKMLESRDNSMTIAV